MTLCMVLSEQAQDGAEAHGIQVASRSALARHTRYSQLYAAARLAMEDRGFEEEEIEAKLAEVRAKLMNEVPLPPFLSLPTRPPILVLLLFCSL
eukprot:213453-Rhodomonas_salina.1